MSTDAVGAAQSAGERPSLIALLWQSRAHAGANGFLRTPAYADTIASGFKAVLAGGWAGEELARPQDHPGHLWAAGQFTSVSRPPNGANNQASASLAGCLAPTETLSTAFWEESAALL